MIGFEGGQTPLAFRTPKRGFVNRFRAEYVPLNLDKLQAWVDDGKLDPSQMITMKHLRDSGAVSHQVRSGVKLLGRGADSLGDTPLHLQVMQSSESAKRAIEAKGGSVTTVYYNKLGLRALLKVLTKSVFGVRLMRTLIRHQKRIRPLTRYKVLTSVNHACSPRSFCFSTLP